MADQAILGGMALVGLVGLWLQIRLVRKLLDPRQQGELFKKIAVNSTIRIALACLLVGYLAVMFFIVLVSVVVSAFNEAVGVGTAIALVIIVMLIVSVLIMTIVKAAVLVAVQYFVFFLNPLVTAATICLIVYKWHWKADLPYVSVVQLLLDWLFSTGPNWMQYVYLAIMGAVSLWHTLSEMKPTLLENVAHAVSKATDLGD